MVQSRGFIGRRAAPKTALPPGQYVTEDFPVLSAGPTPHVPLEQWEFAIDDGKDVLRRWSWRAFRELPSEHITADIHCVTRWSKLDTAWEGVSLDTLLDLLDGQAWVAFNFDGKDLAPEHGGPARLIVPHLYFWKSAKWVRGITLLDRDEPGFWESNGYHIYGDPWQEQRFSGD